jgi:hypothetical protein
MISKVYDRWLLLWKQYFIFFYRGRRHNSNYRIDEITEPHVWAISILCTLRGYTFTRMTQSISSFTSIPWTCTPRCIIWPLQLFWERWNIRAHLTLAHCSVNRQRYMIINYTTGKSLERNRISMYSYYYYSFFFSSSSSSSFFIPNANGTTIRKQYIIDNNTEIITDNSLQTWLRYLFPILRGRISYTHSSFCGQI